MPSFASPLDTPFSILPQTVLLLPAQAPTASMEPAPLSSLQEDGEPEESPSSPSPSAFSADAVPPRPATHRSLHKYEPLDWSAYFDEERPVVIPDTEDVFNVYMAGSEGPVVFCLHGGGYSGLSFALAANRIKEKSHVVAMDLRGHGKSTTSDDLDLSIETLTNDVISVIRTMYGDSTPAIILVGHSMGGSVAVHVAARKVFRNLHGLVVVDVVEGTAMASLVHMQKILANRAHHFPNIEKAIEWSVKGGSLRNIESARISVPPTLKYDESRECYTYRTPLEKTEKYWKGWYEGLSDKFLSCPVQKILLLAGTDRLDRALTIGQMQGKFQMVVVRHTGHAIQEDVPEEFASHILTFISRNKIGPNGVEIPGLAKTWQH
ncbi:protein phosphatase methylesterase 1 [Brachypodium distachyon]|nr:protein phosphatase methylesterase 1 [Brachypodium distachyon]|eukprot:XP_003579844.2 protein phosphatase methylesterase 1 [Brachypodium distachyon]